MHDADRQQDAEQRAQAEAHHRRRGRDIGVVEQAALAGDRGGEDGSCRTRRAIWSGVGSTGRSMDQVAATRSLVLQGWPLRFSRSRTCGALRPTAAAYQSARMMSTTVITGSVRPSARRRQAPLPGRVPWASPATLIGPQSS